MDNEISHEDFETIINEEKKYWELKESIRMMNSQGGDADKLVWLKKGKNEVLMKLLNIMRLLIMV